MKFLKKGKRPLIPDDTVVQKNGSQEYQKEKADKPKTETAIVKSILSKRLKKRLEDIEDIIQRAENLVNWTAKGTLISLEGEIRTRNYEKDGQKHFVVEVWSNFFQVLHKPNQEN